MKKCITIVFLISIFLIALPMTACGGSGVREYFPFQENVLLTYASQCDEPFYYHVFIDYIRDTRIQRRMIFRNIMWAEILEVRDGGIVLVNMFDDFFEHVDMTARPAQLYGRVLNEPIAVGTSWYEHPGDGSARRKITGTDISITTPAGTFTAIEVTITQPARDGFVVAPWLKEFYAPGVGLVKSIESPSGVREGQTEPEFIVTVLLTEIERDVGFERLVTIFYLDEQEQTFTQSIITYQTNNDIREIYMNLIRGAVEHLFGHTLNPLAAINFYWQDRHEPGSRTVIVDFNSHFMDDFALITDPAREIKAFYALVNTLAELFNVDGVHISIDDIPFSGRSIQLRAREFLPFGIGLE